MTRAINGFFLIPYIHVTNYFSSVFKFQFLSINSCCSCSGSSCRSSFSIVLWSAVWSIKVV